MERNSSFLDGNLPLALMIKYHTEIQFSIFLLIGIQKKKIKNKKNKKHWWL